MKLPKISKKYWMVIAIALLGITLSIGEYYRVDNIKKEFYQEGIDEGYANGRHDGYQKGHDDGYNEGYNDGISKGRRVGYSRGYNDAQVNTTTCIHCSGRGVEACFHCNGEGCSMCGNTGVQKCMMCDGRGWNQY